MDQSEPPARTTASGQIAAALRAQIAAGVYAPGDRLPSTRALAAERGLSRTTVTAAYEQLLAEGYLDSRQGARTVVAPGLRPQADRAAPRRTGPPPASLSGFGRRLAVLPVPPAPAPPTSGPGRLVADFRFGDLAVEDFPLLAWKRALNGALLRRAGWLGYGEPAGSPALRSALAAYLWRARGLRCAAAQIVVVNGSQQGLDLCARLALDPGARAVVEDPGYLMARHTFLAAGAKLVPVPVDQEGLCTDALPRDGAARIAHVTPSHQFPLGGVLSAPRRAALLAWARREGAWIIEDDHDSEYRFDIDPIPPLAAHGEAAGVIYLGTVSKTLSPALRLGYLVLAPDLVEVFQAAKRLADRHTPSLEQEALAELIASGAYERHVRRMRRRNGERRAALLAALSACLGERVAVVGAEAGLHVLAWFTDVPRAREAALIAAARTAGVGLYPVTPLYDPDGAAPRPDRAGAVLGYGGLDPRGIAAGVQRLAGVLDGIS
ncbi:MAG: PLP-dependent aminotransferase family protein [Proteobacteria bacterium]|nr:PLP-dependent aminotransferase family protein [Pseudomonadota bacterium]